MSRRFRIMYLIFAFLWMGGWILSAQHLRSAPDPTPLTVEAFRFESVEDRVKVLEDSRFTFGRDLSALTVSVNELVKASDAERMWLIAMSVPVLGLFAEMFMRLKGQKEK